VYNTYAIFIFAGAFYFKLDPLYVIIKESDVIRSNRCLFYLATIIRCIIIFIGVLGAVRQTFLSLVMLIILNRMNMNILHIILHDLRNKNMWNKIAKYIEFQMYLKLTSKQENVTFALLVAGTLTAAGGNYICVLYHNDVPPILYPCILSPLVISYFGMNMILPTGIKIHENSASLLDKLFSECPRFNSYTKRKVRSLQASYVNVAIGSYRVFYFKRSTKATFYRTVLDLTLNFLMGIPRDDDAQFTFN